MPLAMVPDPEEIDVNAVMNRLPWLRKLIARSLYMINRIMKQVSTYFANEEIEKLAYDVRKLFSLI